MTIAPITLYQPRRLAVGAGTIAEVGAWAADARSVLVIATPITAGFVDRLKLSGRVAVFDAIPGEPDVDTLDAALDFARQNSPDLIVGLGGGSVLDVAKLVAVLWDLSRRLPMSPGQTAYSAATPAWLRSQRPPAPARKPGSARSSPTRPRETRSRSKART